MRKSAIIKITKGIELVSKFNELARKAHVRSTLKEGVMKQTEHEIDFGNSLIVSAYVAKFRTDFWTGYKLSNAFINYTFANFGTDENFVNNNYDLPPWIVPRLKALYNSSQTEFVFRIKLTDEEYKLFTMMPHLPIVSDSFFRSVKPALVL